MSVKLLCFTKYWFVTTRSLIWNRFGSKYYLITTVIVQLRDFSNEFYRLHICGCVFVELVVVALTHSAALPNETLDCSTGEPICTTWSGLLTDICYIFSHPLYVNTCFTIICHTISFNPSVTVAVIMLNPIWLSMGQILYQNTVNVNLRP